VSITLSTRLIRLRKRRCNSAAEMPFKISVASSRRSISSGISPARSARSLFSQTVGSPMESYHGNKVVAGVFSARCARKGFESSLNCGGCIVNVHSMFFSPCTPPGRKGFLIHRNVPERRKEIGFMALTFMILIASNRINPSRDDARIDRQRTSRLHDLASGCVG
jgi:hypothetical protein